MIKKFALTIFFIFLGSVLFPYPTSASIFNLLPTNDPHYGTKGDEIYIDLTSVVDVLNHLKTSKDPLNHTTTYNYDNNENRSSVVDAEGHTTEYIYDERNLLFKIKDANSAQGTTQYDYDVNANLSKVTDANNHATAYTYDLFDRKLTETFADSKVYSFGYDKNSNVTQITKPSTTPAVTIQQSYDALNRLTSKAYPSHPSLDVGLTYDLGSRLTDANTTVSNNHLTYDNLNRLQTNTQTINAVPYNLSYEYDKAGNRTSSGDTRRNPN